VKIEYKTGNIIDCEEEFIAHGCNAQGVMGAGVAGLIRSTYPESYDYYRWIHYHGGLHVGQTYSYLEKDKMIIHCITQYGYGRVGRYVDYNAVKSCMMQISNMFPGMSVAMPKIGAGLGGGNWDKLEEIIEHTSEFQPVVYEL